MSLFKAKDMQGKEIKGYYLRFRDKHYITDSDDECVGCHDGCPSPMGLSDCTQGGCFHPIDPTTLAMNTGRRDKNDKPIYGSFSVDDIESTGGDWVDWYVEDIEIRHEYKKCEVFWHPEFAGFMLRTKDDMGAWH